MLQKIISDALEEANVNYNEIEYVEAHGAGTQAGDQIEAVALGQIFCKNRKKPLLIGTIKCNIGDTEASSAICGIIKSLIAFETNLIPPNIKYETPNLRAPDLVEGRLKVVTEPTTLNSDYIPVNSVGYGGTLVETILKRNPITKENRERTKVNISRLVLYPATTEEGVNFVFEYIQNNPDLPDEFFALLHNLSFCAPLNKPYRGYALCQERKSPVIEIKNASSNKRQIWYVMTGMGCQWPGMGLDHMKIDVFAESMHRSAEILKPFGIDLFGLLKGGIKDNHDNRKITVSFVTICAIQIALVDLLKHLDVTPDGMVGHSTGELLCAYADGCLTHEQTLLSSYYRGQSVENANIPQGGMAAVDDFMRGRIIGKIEEGRKITDVAREFDITHSVVSRLWKSFKTTGMCSRWHGGGRVRSTTPAEDRYIVLSAKRNRRTTAQQVANQFFPASGKQISRKTVARRLRGGGLYARRPVVCVPLTRQHRTARLQWCREHHNWTEQDWTCVLFSDESRFSLSSDCRRQLIWRESDTAYRPENIQGKDRYPTCSIMVWAVIVINGRTRLHVVTNGTMTGQRYIEVVLLPLVRLFRGAVGDKFVFIYDNATCHRTLAVQDCLDSEGIQRLVWPARSPDLNPIENVWDALGRQVAGRNYPPTNKNTLIRALTEEWDKLPQQLLDNVVQSLSWSQAQKICPEGIYPACDNATDSVTISGEKEPLEKFVEKLKQENIFVRLVNSHGYGFHCKHVHAAAPALKKAQEKLVPSPKHRSKRWVSSSYIESEWDNPDCKMASAEYFVHNLTSSVRFNDAIQKIPPDAIVIEIGPHFLLQSILKRSVGTMASYFGLMKRNEVNNVDFLMESLGKKRLLEKKSELKGRLGREDGLGVELESITS
ncbi:fatty acid synthase [Trichonephila clavipes]|nr:fatty acid synthase [Trichonephila clavipes]